MLYRVLARLKGMTKGRSVVHSKQKPNGTSAGPSGRQVCLAIRFANKLGILITIVDVELQQMCSASDAWRDSVIGMYTIRTQ